MSTTRSAIQCWSQSTRNPTQCLLRRFISSPTSSSKACNPLTSPGRLFHSVQSSTNRQSLLNRSYSIKPQMGLCGNNQREPAVARRAFSTTAELLHNELTRPKPGEELRITFIDKEGEEHTFEVAKGDNLLDIALENDIDMEGACGGSCACSTCHVIVEDDSMYDKMGELDDDENDMLDLAFGLTETSRLGCQVKMTADLNGLRVRLPSMTRNMQASDFSKKNERSDA